MKRREYENEKVVCGCTNYQYCLYTFLFLDNDIHSPENLWFMIEVDNGKEN